jgi:hypothetical protein
MSWDAVSAICAIVGVLIVAVTAYYGLNQLRELKTTRRTELLVTLHERYHNPQMQAFRRRLIRGELPDLDTLSTDDANALAGLLNELEFFATFVRKGLLDAQDLADLFGGSPARVAQHIGPFVAGRRRQEPGYLRTFEEQFGIPFGSQPLAVGRPAEMDEPESVNDAPDTGS